MVTKAKKPSTQIAADVQEILNSEAKDQGKTVKEVLKTANDALNGNSTEPKAEGESTATPQQEAAYRISNINALANADLATNHVIEAWDLIKRELPHFVTNEFLLEYYNSKEVKATDYDPKIVTGQYISEVDTLLQMWSAKISVTMTLIEMETEPTVKFMTAMFTNIYKQLQGLDQILSLLQKGLGDIFHHLDVTTVLVLYPFASKCFNENRRLSAHPGALSDRPYRIVQILPKTPNNLMIRMRFGFGMPEDVRACYSINDTLVRVFAEDMTD